MSHEGPFYLYVSFAEAHEMMLAVSTHDLVQTLGSTETSRSHANDENVNVAVTCQSKFDLRNLMRQRLGPQN